MHGYFIFRSTVSSYWCGSQLHRLKTIAKRVCSVQASSAPVERVFSHAGLIFSPKRTRLSEDLFTDLVFLKVNQIFLWGYALSYIVSTLLILIIRSFILSYFNCFISLFRLFPEEKVLCLPITFSYQIKNFVNHSLNYSPLFYS